jgi:hypothetical protein
MWNLVSPKAVLDLSAEERPVDIVLGRLPSVARWVARPAGKGMVIYAQMVIRSVSQCLTNQSSHVSDSAGQRPTVHHCPVEIRAQKQVAGLGQLQCQ